MGAADAKGIQLKRINKKKAALPIQTNAPIQDLYIQGLPFKAPDVIAFCMRFA
jgi:hypothetical protein